MKRRILLYSALCTLILAQPAFSSEELANNVGDYANLSLEELLDVTIYSASKQEESVNEAPVPVTVITSKMIENIGARTLKDVLITYVPGITFSQDQNDVNVSMRGVYASSQQKILIMINGHRLNSRAFSSSDPDYGISLDNIKQIEVLRGPGSSLYGNIALTGIVNIITKKGEDVNGSYVKGSIGNNGQKRVSYLHGNKFSEKDDILLWGNYYEADGEKVLIPKEKDYSDKPQEGFAIIDGFKNKPSYDVGLVYNFGDFSIFAKQGYSNYIEPFSAGGKNGKVYDYDKYRTIFGIGSGQSNKNSHFDFSYKKSFENDIEFSFNGYNDYNDTQIAYILDPSIQEHGLISFHDTALGFTSQVMKGYDFENFGKGNILFGAQIERMSVYDSSYFTGINGEFDKFVDTNAKKILEPGSETVYSLFTQAKHRMSDNLIFNFGLRYDEKQRFKANNLRDFSPRLAIIYLPSELFQMKLSYAQSFVDSPYWYRYNSNPTFLGSPDLKPEHLRSLQFSLTSDLLEKRLNNNINVFYNDLYDFLYRDPQAGVNDIKYKNAGSLKSIGIEEDISFIQDFYTIRGNLTYQKAISAQGYPITGSEINNIPSLFGNLIFDVRPLYWLYNKFSVNLTGRYIGSQVSPILNNYLDGKAINLPENRVNQAFIVNTGFRVTEPWLEKITLDGRIYNLLDTKYEQGGTVVHPYPQAGRWFLLSLEYKF